jgi:hypothetical protein
MLLATAEALGWLGKRYADDRLVRARSAIESAVASIIARGEPLTADLGGSSTRSAVAAAIRDDVARQLSH